jgi:hypothetical protein
MMTTLQQSLASATAEFLRLPPRELARSGPLGLAPEGIAMPFPQRTLPVRHPGATETIG